MKFYRCAVELAQYLPDAGSFSGILETCSTTAAGLDLSSEFLACCSPQHPSQDLPWKLIHPTPYLQLLLDERFTCVCFIAGFVNGRKDRRQHKETIGSHIKQRRFLRLRMHVGRRFYGVLTASFGPTPHHSYEKTCIAYSSFSQSSNCAAAASSVKAETVQQPPDPT